MSEAKAALFSLLEVGEILGSKMEGGPGFHQASISGVSTDSRAVGPGELFVAIKGKNFDGHDFLNEAFDRGAVAAIICRDRAPDKPNPKCIVVGDTLKALGDLAAVYRRRMSAKVVGVTGSNGKTTVKNLIYDILAANGPAIKSKGNFNNFIGLPLSLLDLRPEHWAGVFEFGMSARGEISRLGEIAHPDIAVITNVGPVHLEFLKTVDQVAEAKLEIVDKLNPPGVLIVNGDDVVLGGKLKSRSLKPMSFGLGTNNDIMPTFIEFDSNQMPMFRVGDTQFASRLPGMHNVYNVLAAFAVSRVLGIPEKQAADTINSFKAQDMRSEILHVNGVTLLVDCYNANPASTKYALETLSKMRSNGHRIAVLADMLELGEAAREYHEEIGEIARRLGIKYLFALGPLSRSTVESFGPGGLHFDSSDALLERLSNTIDVGDIVLFKGSRGMVLEKVVEAVKDKL